MSNGPDFYKDLLNNLYDGVYFIDKNRKITYWNSAAERITGYSSTEVIGRSCSDNILMHMNSDGINLCEGSCPAVEAMKLGELREAEIFMHHKEGYRLPIQTRITPIRNDKGEVVGAVEVFREISSIIAMRQMIKELERLALLDSITELGNRRFGEINIRSRLGEMERYNWNFGLLFVDIDHFKRVNDVYGHYNGDRVLKMVGATLRNNVRYFDVVCRWGEEEFVLVIASVDKEHLFYIANRTRVFVKNSSLAIDNNNVRVTVSIGATLARKDDTVDSLIRRADGLMYQCKASGRDCIKIG